MTCGTCPACKINDLVDALQLDSITINRELLKRQYKLEVAKADVELARLAGSELDLCYALFAKAKAEMKLHEMQAKVLEFEAEANAEYEARVAELMSTSFELVVIDMEMDIFGAPGITLTA